MRNATMVDIDAEVTRFSLEAWQSEVGFNRYCSWYFHGVLRVLKVF